MPTTAAATASPEPSQSTPAPVPVTPSKNWQIPDVNRAIGDQWGAYLGASSLLPGEPLTVHISAEGPAAVTPYRIGDYGGVGGAQVGPSVGVTVTESSTPPQVDPALLSTVAGWPETTRLDTSGWPDGFYLIQVAAEGTAANIPLVVRTEDLTDKVVFIAGDLTWQAYNNWGGRSLYGGPGGFADRSFAVSFDRPYSSEWEIWNEFDVPIVRVLEETGVPLGVHQRGRCCGRSDQSARQRRRHQQRPRRVLDRLLPASADRRPRCRLRSRLPRRKRRLLAGPARLWIRRREPDGDRVQECRTRPAWRLGRDHRQVS